MHLRLAIIVTLLVAIHNLPVGGQLNLRDFIGVDFSGRDGMDPGDFIDDVTDDLNEVDDLVDNLVDNLVRSDFDGFDINSDLDLDDLGAQFNNFADQFTDGFPDGSSWLDLFGDNSWLDGLPQGSSWFNHLGSSWWEGLIPGESEWREFIPSEVSSSWLDFLPDGTRWWKFFPDGSSWWHIFATSSEEFPAESSWFWEIFDSSWYWNDQTSSAEGLFGPLFSRPGYLIHDVKITDVMNLFGDVIDASSIRESLLIFCEFAESNKDLIDDYTASEAQPVVDTIQNELWTLCDQAQAESATIDIEETCSDLMETFTMLMGDMSEVRRKKRMATPSPFDGDFDILPSALDDAIYGVLGVDLFDGGSFCNKTRDLLEMSSFTLRNLTRTYKTELVSYVDWAISYGSEHCYVLGENFTSDGIRHFIGNLTENYLRSGDIKHLIGNFTEDYSHYVNFSDFEPHRNSFVETLIGVLTNITEQKDELCVVMDNMKEMLEEADYYNNTGPVERLISNVTNQLAYLLEDEDTCTSISELVNGLLEQVEQGVLNNFNLSNFENPFTICKDIGDNLQNSMGSIIGTIYRPIMTGILEFLTERVKEYVCGAGEKWSSSTDEFDDFGNIVGEIMVVIGGYGSREELCSSFPEELWEEWWGSSLNIGQDTFTVNVSNYVDMFFTMVTDANECEDVVELLENMYNVDFNSVTGFPSTEDMCAFMVESFKGNANLEILNMLGLSSDDMSSFDLFTLLDPNSIDWATPISYYQSLLAIFGVSFNTDTLIDNLAIICEHFGGPLSLLTGSHAGDFNELCNAYVSQNFSTLNEEHQEMCERVLVPMMTGEEDPLAFINLPEWEDEFQPEVFEAAGMALIGIGFTPDLDFEDICSIAGDMFDVQNNFLDVFLNIVDEVALFMVEGWFVGFCESKDVVFEYLFPDDNDDDDLESMLNEMVGLMTGMGSLDNVCTSLQLLKAAGSNRDDLKIFIVTIRENIQSFLTNAAKCQTLFEQIRTWFSNDDSVPGPFSNIVTTLDGILYYAGFADESEFCEALAFYTNPEGEEEVCYGIVDCAGECNGNAKKDCAGVCNGRTVVDCAGECAGSAYINNCTECVGGRTGRASNFGADRCGNCRKADGYKEVWDCYGTCNGEAFYDKCGVCIGGESGRPPNYSDARLDCRGICDGGWVADTCNFCEPPTNTVYNGGSKYMDCTLSCVKPGLPHAYENECSECVGGSSGHSEDYGKNVCNQCESDPDADPSSCEGCDGVANSGLELDACGVCGGDGTDCVGVGRVFPNLIPDTSVEIDIIGAGFSRGSDLTCLFTNTNTGSEFEGQVVERLSNQYMKCLADLDEGDYEVGVRRDSDLPTNIVAPLKVFANIQIDSFTPNEVTVNMTLVDTPIDIVATASTSSAFAELRSLDSEIWDVNPALLAVTNEGDTWEIPGEFLSDDIILYHVRHPANSGRLDARPTINGKTSLDLAVDPSYLTAYYQAPEVFNAKFTPEGAGLKIHFDLGVDYENFDSCDDLFTNVISLGNGAVCKWQSPRDLNILMGKGESLIEIGDTLEIAPDTIYAFRQEFGHPASGNIVVAGPDIALQPEAFISGSPKLPSCGDVRLSGRRSTGGGGRAMTFQWSVSSAGDTSNITSEINSVNSMNGGMGGPDLELDGDYLDADTEYVFTLTVSNFLGGSDSASFSVERSGVAAPEVKVLPNGVDTSSVKVSDSFTLTADIKFYSECVPAGETVFEWSCDNADVPLNLKTLYTRTLYVESNSLPGGENVEFTVKVYKSSDPSAYVEQSLVVTTIKSDLVAIIKGATEFTTGRDSGTITIDGSLSYDPDEEARQWEYEWQCVQTTDSSACWSYDPDHLGELIINDTNIDGAVLSFDALAFEADKSYEITLIAIKEERSASATVKIDAVNGDPPKVEFAEIQDDGKVKDTDVIFLTAYIYSSAEVAEATWTTVGTEEGGTSLNFNPDYWEKLSSPGETYVPGSSCRGCQTGYGFIDLTDSNNLILEPMTLDSNAGFIIAMIGIAGGVAERGTSYAFLLNATTTDNQWGTAKAYITVRSGPTSCEFSVEDYEELSSTVVLTENCVTEAEAQPLSFQLFTESEDGNLETVTEQKSEPSFSIVGIPSEVTDGTRKYIIKVCNKFAICSEYDGTALVTEKVSFTTEEKEEYKSAQVNEPKFKGDYQSALGNLNLLADIEQTDSSSRRRRTAAETTSETASEQLELIVLTLEETVLTTSSAQLLIDNTASLVISDLSLEDQFELLDHFLAMIAIFEDAEETVPESSSDLILAKVGEIADGLDPINNENILDKCKAVQEKLLGSLTSDLVLGGGVTEIIDRDVSLGIQKTLLSGSFDSKSTGDQVLIDFGSELSSLYGAAWTCSTGSTCSGVTLKISHYNTDVDYFSKTDDDVNSRAADIIEVILADPESDEQLNVTGLSSPVTINFPLTISHTNVEYSCVYWDTTSDAWSTSNIDTDDLGDGSVDCASSHLTVFTVMGIPLPTTIETPTTEADTGDTGGSILEGSTLYIIIGSVISVILIVIVVLLIIICCKMDSSKHAVSPEACVEEGEAAQPQQPVTIKKPIPPPPGHDQLGYEDLEPPGAIPEAPIYYTPRQENDTSGVLPPKGNGESNAFSDYVGAVMGQPLQPGYSKPSDLPAVSDP